MPISKKLETPLIAVVSILVIAAFGFAGWLWYELPVVAILTVTIAALLSYLIASNRLGTINQIYRRRLLHLCFAICLFASFAVMANSRKHSAYIPSYFIDGELEQKWVFVEGDGEEAGHYKEKYGFRADSDKGSKYADMIVWGMVAVYGLSLFITIRNLPKLPPAKHL